MTEQALLERLDRIATAMTLQKPALWGIEEIAAYFGLGQTSARSITARPDFPKPIKLLEGVKGRRWSPAEVEAWALKQREPIRGRVRAG